MVTVVISTWTGRQALSDHGICQSFHTVGNVLNSNFNGIAKLSLFRKHLGVFRMYIVKMVSGVLKMLLKLS